MKMVETHSFESAYARLKEIHRLLHTQDLVDIDAIITLQQEAKELHDFLLSRLSTIEQQNNDVKASV